MATKWVETTVDVYRAIYNVHHKEFTVFLSFTSESDFVTAWGFKQADYPLIKSENRSGVWKYFLAQNENIED